MPYPAKYDPQLAEKLPDMFNGGESVVEVCVSLGIARKTFYMWVKEYPEFGEAFARGKERSEAWWTRIGRAAAAGKVNGFMSGPWIFNMKNRFGWKDQADITVTQNAGIALLPPQMDSIEDWSNQAQEIIKTQQKTVIEHNP